MGKVSRKSLRDQKILEMYGLGRTTGEVAETLGVSEEYAYSRIKQLLAEGDIFTVMEQRKLLIYQMKSLLSKASDFLDNASDKSWAPGVAAITKLLETTYEIQVKEEAQSEEELQAATRAQAGVLIRAVEMAYNRARELLTNEYPNVDIALIDAAFQQGLEEA